MELLGDARPERAAVIGEANFSALEEVAHCRSSLVGVTAHTGNREDQVPQGEGSAAVVF